MPAQLYYKAQQLRELDAPTGVCRSATGRCAGPAWFFRTSGGSCRRGRVCTAKRRRTSVWRGAAVSRACLISPMSRAVRAMRLCVVDGQDLPIGLQLAGRPFADGLLLQVAHAYEQSTTWHTRRPPIVMSSLLTDRYHERAPGMRQLTQTVTVQRLRTAAEKRDDPQGSSGADQSVCPLSGWAHWPDCPPACRLCLGRPNTGDRGRTGTGEQELRWIPVQDLMQGRDGICQEMGKP